MVWEHWLQAARAFAGEMGYDPHRPLEGPEPPFLSFADAWPRFFLQAFERSGVTGLDPQAIVDFLFDELSRAHPYPEAAGVIARLRAAGVIIAIASNADDAHLHPVLARHAIQADVVISSEAVRSYKPRRPFFDALLRTLELPPEKVLHVGDSLLADVAGAHHAGMATYWVRRYEHSTTTTMTMTTTTTTTVVDATWTFPDLRAVPTVVGVPGG